MNYPDFPQLLGSRRLTFAGKKAYRSKSGQVRFHSAYAAVEKGFRVVHELSPEDYVTFMQFYEDNIDVTFDFTWAKTGEVFQVQFSEQDVEEEELAGVLTQVACTVYVM